MSITNCRVSYANPQDIMLVIEFHVTSALQQAARPAAIY